MRRGPAALLARLVATLVGALLLAGAPVGADAQILRGYVVDESTGEALSDVVVTVLLDGSALASTVTDSTGAFRHGFRDSITVQVEAVRLGYRTILTRPLHVPAGDTLVVDVWTGVQAIAVDSLVVTAEGRRGRSRFRRHMEEWGRGVYMTPEMIDSIAPVHPADVLRGQDKTWFTWTQGERVPIPNIRTFLGQGCVKFMLNRVGVRKLGEEVSGGGAFEDTALESVLGRDIVAVEYFRYIGEVPPELRRYALEEGENPEMCGLVVYWTREGW